MDTVSNLVDSRNPVSARLRPATPDSAETVDSTRGGTLGDRRPSRPYRAVEEGRVLSYRTGSDRPRGLTEDQLIEAYGLDPDDLELEVLEPRIRRR